MVQQLIEDNFENVDTFDKGTRPKKKANVLRSGWPQALTTTTPPPRYFDFRDFFGCLFDPI